MMHHHDDERWMDVALEEARSAAASGDYPVGAALVVGGDLWSSARNPLFSDGRTTAHAEHQLIAEHSARLRAIPRGQDAVPICLYTTLEPCLMCLGSPSCTG